ncbi:MAG: hypothetical protein PWQ41_114 [Bacillota bacterium]|jgi:hypothetical protein|nr:hypothetical protein [Bacillota bacterium]MDK2924340.1 hypothetical protein [Bacillota bacterium]
MLYRKHLVLVCAIVLTLTFAAGCRRPAEPAQEATYQADEPAESPAPDEVASVPQAYCPLDGLPVEDPELADRRPVAVMIDNLSGIGPQSGLDKACWVFEILTEGGITRLMPVYLHQDAPVVGPVRSARHYFLDKALEFGAAYSHCGWSPQAQRDIQQLKVISLNEFYLPQVYWRVRSKKEPHNVYTSTDRLFQELDRRGLLTNYSRSWQLEFHDDPSALSGPSAKKITLKFPGGYTVEYRWDEGIIDGGYRRFVNGRPHEDAETGRQLVAKNILVQFVDGTRVLDKEGRLDMQLVGRGTGRVFQQGITYEANWSKGSRTDFTYWTTKEGQTVKLARGQTWVEVMPRGAEVTWE